MRRLRAGAREEGEGYDREGEGGNAAWGHAAEIITGEGWRLTR